MRIQLHIPDDLASVLGELAFKANRPLRQQAEILLWRAIERAVQSRDSTPDEKEATYVAG